jgi:Zn-dependent protease with chaperone function
MTREYLVHGVTLALAWFAVANLIASAMVVVAARWSAADDRPRTPGWWFGLRCVPAAAAVAFVGVVFVPSYIRFEPRATIEGFDLTLTICAAGALALIVASFARAMHAWQRASHQAAVWMRGARRYEAPSAVPAYTIGSAPAPLMALVGVLSPRVFVSDRLVDVLSRDELDATLAHEASHARSHDNVKRLVMRLLPDALALGPMGGAIERRWASAAEHAADRAATGGDAAARCALASALVKVARLMPAERRVSDLTRASDPISTLVGGGDLASRVESLLGDAPAVVASPRVRWPGVAAVAVAAIAYAPALHAVHEITELLVNSLP